MGKLTKFLDFSLLPMWYLILVFNESFFLCVIVITFFFYQVPSVKRPRKDFSVFSSSCHLSTTLRRLRNVSYYWKSNREDVNTNFYCFCLARQGIEPDSTVSEQTLYPLNHWSSELGNRQSKRMNLVIMPFNKTSLYLGGAKSQSKVHCLRCGQISSCENCSSGRTSNKRWTEWVMWQCTIILKSFLQSPSATFRTKS